MTEEREKFVQMYMQVRLAFIKLNEAIPPTSLVRAYADPLVLEHDILKNPRRGRAILRGAACRIFVDTADRLEPENPFWNIRLATEQCAAIKEALDAWMDCREAFPNIRRFASHYKAVCDDLPGYY